VISALHGRRVGLLDRPHAAGHEGAIADELIPLLQGAGARAELVHAEMGVHRLDRPPRWDLVVLKSGSAAALHLASAAEGWGVRTVNRSEATRLAQDKLAATAILQQAGLPIARAYIAWLDGVDAYAPLAGEFAALGGRAWIVKAGRGSQGIGLWSVEVGALPRLIPTLPAGPYLLMERVPHDGDDLKIFAAGTWLSAIERPFPATTFAAKLGRMLAPPRDAAAVAREAGRQLGLTCFGCDFVRGPTGWTLVDVNAFPGYKGARGAAAALVAEITRVAEEEPR
jgi:ribosomal protein S6--L-glutamate ligase